MLGSICESRLYDTTCFLRALSSLFQHVDLVTTSLTAGFQIYLSWPGFCVHRPRQYDTICWDLNLSSGFFAFFWLIAWADGINKCGWCLVGGTGCWLQGPHQIPNVSWIHHHSLHVHIYQIASFVSGILCPLYCYYKCWGDGIGGGWLIYNTVWEGGQGVAIILKFLFFFTCPFVLVFWCPLSLFLSD